MMDDPGSEGELEVYERNPRAREHVAPQEGEQSSPAPEKGVGDQSEQVQADECTDQRNAAGDIGLVGEHGGARPKIRKPVTDSNGQGSLQGAIEKATAKAKAAFKKGDLEKAKEEAEHAFSLTWQAMKHFEMYGTIYSADVLAKSFATIGPILFQVGDIMNAMRCFYSELIYDAECDTNGRSEVTLSLYQALWRLPVSEMEQDRCQLMKDLTHLVELTQRHERWDVCFTISTEVYAACSIIEKNSALAKFVKKSKEKCLMATARSALKLGIHEFVRFSCNTYLQDFCEYNNSEILEIWALSLQRTGKLEPAIDKARDALKYATGEDEKSRLKQMIAEMEDEQVALETEASAYDSDWLEGTHAYRANTEQPIVARKKKRHKRPKAKESTSPSACEPKRQFKENRQTTEKMSVHHSISIAASNLDLSTQSTYQGLIPEKGKETQLKRLPDSQTRTTSLETSAPPPIRNYQQIIPDSDDTESNQNSDDSSFFPDSSDSEDRDDSCETNDEFEEETSTGDDTFYEKSLRMYRESNESENVNTGDRRLLQNGLQLNAGYLRRFEDKKRQVNSRPPFYEDLKSPQESLQLLEREPNVYKRCILHLEGPHSSLCKPLDPNESITQIEISGRSKAGQMFNEDEVVVELLDNELSKGQHTKHAKPAFVKNTNEKRFGKVIGFLERHRHRGVKNPVFVCTLDEMESHLVRPLCKTLPKIHIMNKEIMETCPRKKKYKVELYSYNSATKELEFKKIVNINPHQRERYVFLVVFINWGQRHIYPRGAVVRILPFGESVSTGVHILDLQCAVPTYYSRDTVARVESIGIRHGSTDCREEMKNDRVDLTNLCVFTIDPPLSRDLDDALSLESENGLYKVGVHITDVAAWVGKDDPIDKEAKDRAMTFYPGFQRPRHMLPEPLSENRLSLLPGVSRLALTVFFFMDENGQMTDKMKPQICKSVVKSSRRFTYGEVQKIIKKDHPSREEPYFNRIKVLFKLAKQRRLCRLGKSMFALKLDLTEEEDDESFTETVEAHYLVEEFMILANSIIAGEILTKYPHCTPIRCQLPPCKEDVQAWLSSHDSFVDITLSLQDRNIADIKQPNMDSVVLSGERRKVMVQRNIRDLILKDTTEGMKYVKMDELHPFQFLAFLEWVAIQKPAEYRCSGQISEHKMDGKHFSLDIFPYTHFTSPIRRYIDLVIQRLLHASFDKKQSPYSSEEIAAICFHSNPVLKRSKLYRECCKSLKVAIELKTRSKQFFCFVEEVSEKGFVFISPEVQKVPRMFREIPFSFMGADSRPIHCNDPQTHRQTVSTSWKKRIYDTKGYHNNLALVGSLEKKVNPHQHAVLMDISEWIDLVKHAIDDNVVGIERILDSLPKHSHGDGTVDDISTEMYQFQNSNTIQIMQPKTNFRMSFGLGQITKIQFSAEPRKGLLTPKPQVFYLVPSLQCCLQHTEDPVRYLSAYATTHTLDSYQNPNEYKKRWLPLLEMEAAVDAVRNEESFIINSVAVRFTETGGKFILHRSFCEERNIQFGGVGLDFLEQDDGDESSIEKAHDWLCIKQQIDNGGSLQVTPTNYTWIGHAKITKIRKRSENDNDSNCKVVVYFTLHPFCPPPIVPQEAGRRVASCSIELITRSDTDRRVERHLKEIDQATSISRQIAMNKRVAHLDDDHVRIAKDVGFDIVRGFQQNHDPDRRQLPKNNFKQTQAIKHALMYRFSLIQGPPGTGKTYTGIKLIVLFDMINKKLAEEGDKRMKVMFCGPSNKSVDLVAGTMKKRLGDACPDILRVYGRSIEDKDYPIPGRAFLTGKSVRNSQSDPDLMDITLHHLIRVEGKQYASAIQEFDRKFSRRGYVPELEEVRKYLKLVRKASVLEIEGHNIILCTTAVATNPKVIRGTKESIFQIVIDEAGMCQEPNCLAPIIATKAEQVVLIGDHKQLRPIILCQQAAELGLEKSLFERYASPLNRVTFTMLDTQYRMNPYLCEFPSDQFYNGELKTEVDKLGMLWQEPPFLNLWPVFQDAQIPRVFCHVEGEENVLTVATEEGNEQSKSNQGEVDHVIKILTYLLNQEKVPVRSINIISQYNAQCFLLRQALGQQGIINCNVNTVVSSQGGEWDYVIFSTVRSLPSYKIEKNPTIGWCKQNLGFIIDENQINVALTRARKGLIIVGNKHLLRCNDVWKNLIDNYEETNCMRTPKTFPPRRKRPVRRTVQDEDGWCSISLR